MITYSAGGTSTACNNVTIINDTSLEGFHNFSVSITSTSLSSNVVEIPSQSLLVQIQDDERKCHHIPAGVVILKGLVSLLALGATVRLLPIADVVEGQSVEVCVTIESQSAQTVGYDVIATLTISDGTASMYA